MLSLKARTRRNTIGINLRALVPDEPRSLTPARSLSGVTLKPVSLRQALWACFGRANRLDGRAEVCRWHSSYFAQPSVECSWIGWAPKST